MKQQHKILVIKLSALGDFIQTFGLMRAIRSYHPKSHITLLTTKPYVSLAKQSAYFDEILIDERPKIFHFSKLRKLYKNLNTPQYDRVYDLQCNDRTGFYFKLFSKKPEWVGTAKGASHRNTSPTRKSGLAFYGHKQTLELANIPHIEIDKMEWMQSDISKFNLTKPYILIASGCAPTRPEKRWSAQHYGIACQQLSQKGYQPVLLGTNDEKEVTNEIKKLCPQSINLTGKTNLLEIVPLAREAAMAIGNDTGPMHFVGPTNTPALVLFSGASNPKRHRPLGNNVYTLQKDDINDITVQEVVNKVKEILELS